MTERSIASDGRICDPEIIRRAYQEHKHFVYLLAHARRDAFYVDAADNWGAIRKRFRQIVEQLQRSRGSEHVMPPILVWFDLADDEMSAQARAREVRTLPHAWQRRLVERLNPDWVDLHADLLGFPIEYTNFVGERCLIKYNDLNTSRQRSDRMEMPDLEK